MTNIIKKPLFILALCLSTMLMTTNALAQEWPLVGGDYWTVTGVEIKDGGDLKYANWLAGQRVEEERGVRQIEGLAQRLHDLLECPPA